MKKLLIVLLADKNGHENMGRALHALLYAKQAKESGLKVELIFDGGGVEWATEMRKSTSHFYDLHKQLLDSGVIKGVCAFCAQAFKVEDKIKALGIHFISEDSGHPNIGARMAKGWNIVTL